MILVTGGVGYIGSHTTIALIEAGFDVLLLDNLCNSSQIAVSRMEKIVGTCPRFIEGDVRDRKLLDTLFAHHPIEGVIHFAGLKAVGESVTKPLEYYDNNVSGTVNLLDAMRRVGCYTLIFSSSATVYGDPATVPIPETATRKATSPYARSKLIIEDILEDMCCAEQGWRIARLRYFNPVGAHKSGLIGEDPRGTPNNLMPFISQVATGRREKLFVFGSDYATRDGTGMRDYIHVMDLAAGHVAALRYLHENSGLLTANLGTGQPYSVLEMVRAFERASQLNIPYEIVERRAGDVAILCADVTHAQRDMNWTARYGLEEMCLDTWHWTTKNPRGYI